MAHLSEEVGPDRTLLVCCSAWTGNPSSFSNLTFTKIPNAVLNKCEFGKDDYSLKVVWSYLFQYGILGDRNAVCEANVLLDLSPEGPLTDGSKAVLQISELAILHRAAHIACTECFDAAEEVLVDEVPDTAINAAMTLAGLASAHEQT